MFKSLQIKSNHRVLRKNKVHTYGAPIFTPDYNTTVLAAKICTNSNKHSMYIRFLWRYQNNQQSINFISGQNSLIV